MTAKRECGSCTLCCTVMAVLELQKPAYKPCEHVCEAGCGVYASRPQSCKVFECLWLKGEVPEWAKPDKINVVFTQATVHLAGQKPAILVHEAVVGASEEDDVREVMARFVIDEHRRVGVIQPKVADAEHSDSE